MQHIPPLEKIRYALKLTLQQWRFYEDFGAAGRDQEPGSMIAFLCTSSVQLSVRLNPILPG